MPASFTFHAAVSSRAKLQECFDGNQDIDWTVVHAHVKVRDGEEEDGYCAGNG
jgi:hypothetical protein